MCTCVMHHTDGDTHAGEKQQLIHNYMHVRTQAPGESHKASRKRKEREWNQGWGEKAQGGDEGGAGVGVGAESR